MTWTLAAAACAAACGLLALPATGAETVAASSAVVTEEKILRRPAAPDVVELADSSRQDAVFVSAPDWKDEAKSRVLRLDPRTLAPAGEIVLPSKGFGVALDDAAGRLYLTQPFNGSIAVVDIGRNALETRIPLVEKVNLENLYRERGASAKQLAFASEQLKKYKIVEDYPYRLRQIVFDGRSGRLFAPGMGFGVESVLFAVDPGTLRLEKTIPGFGFNAVGIALDEKNGRVFVSNMQGQLVVVDAQKLEIVDKFEIEADQLLNLVYDPATNRLFGVDQGVDRDLMRNMQLGTEYKRRSAGHRVFVLDADTGKTLANLPTDPFPVSLRHDARRQRLYVTNRGGLRDEEGKGTLTIYDTAAYALLQTLALPPHPNSLAFGENGDVLYVTVKNDGAGKKAGKPESVVRIDLR
ncbi:MAG: YncE family protein [Pseudochelatococcus sp.]|jgi:DNA-binding beta-propeller fold protein YncE|uniref:YncE family protein n=1 Tax=Pseudochelatococcus sp. TaxID=2020869 RepID=UPI003D8C9A55